ncbi:hypothetical protein PO909_028012 [Leuciscus waleckii]
MEGEDVTLNTDVTEVQGDDLIEWRFGDKGSLIAEIRGETSEIYDTGLDERFLDRLKLDKKTGSLTIMNTRNVDTGLRTLMATFLCVSLFLCFAVTNEERNISVKEGEPLPLNPETEIQKDDQIQWMFEDIPIAEIRGGTGKTHDDDERFRGRLTLDEETGSLTITDMRIEHVGDYKLQISNSRGTTKKTFVVTVYTRLKSVKEGEPLTLKADAEIQKDVLIQWMFGDQDILIAEIRGGTGKTHDDDVRFRDRLKLDEETGSLTITRMRPEHTGVYKLQISGSRGTTNKRFKVFVYAYISENVLEGKDATLSSDTYIVKDEVKWFFNDKLLAMGIDGGISKTSYCGDERFKDRLELNHQTGSLTIKNTRTSDTGVYYIKFPALGIERKFDVTVSVRNISVEEGEPVTLDPETEIQEDDQIQWRFGDQDIPIAEIRGGTGKTHDDDGRFGGRLKLDEKTGSLIITDTTAEQSGVYKLQISSSRGTTNMRFVVSVSGK